MIASNTNTCQKCDILDANKKVTLQVESNSAENKPKKSVNLDDSHSSSFNDDSNIHENILRAELIAEQNRKMLKSEIKFCEKNKHLFENNKQSLIKDPTKLLSQISENINDDSLPSFREELEEEKAIKNPNNTYLSENQINNLMEIVKYDYIPKLQNEFNEEASSSFHKSNGFSVEEEQHKSNISSKDNPINLPFHVYEFDEEKIESFRQGKNKEFKDSAIDSEKKKNIRLSYLIQNKSLKSCEGYLKKQSPSLFQGWQIRYCKVLDKKFVYYQNESMEKPLGFLDFDLVTFIYDEVIKDNKITEIRLQPKTCSRIFKFKTMNKNDPNDLKKWSLSLQENIAASMGAKKNMIKLCKVPRFWMNDRISEEQFTVKADTLDILLFKGKTFISKIQRSLTRSQYDHVALILRYGNDDLVLLESTGKLGVGLCSWSSFVRNNWQNLYKKMIFRHLDLPRTDALIEKLEKFVKIVIGKKYKVSPSKLLNRKSVIKNISDESFNDRTFFCSELVASAYKCLNLLPEDIASSQYWPGSFSSEKNLQLKGCKLSEEFLIDFEINENPKK